MFSTIWNTFFNFKLYMKGYGYLNCQWTWPTTHTNLEYHRTLNTLYTTYAQLMRKEMKWVTFIFMCFFIQSKPFTQEPKLTYRKVAYFVKRHKLFWILNSWENNFLQLIFFYIYIMNSILIGPNPPSVHLVFPYNICMKIIKA